MQRHHIRVAVAGLGHQGGRSLVRLLDLRRVLQREGIDLDVVAAADTDPTARDRFLQYAGLHGRTLQTFDSLEKMLASIARTKSAASDLIVYDASPSQLHFSNLLLTSVRGAASLVEKPIALDETGLALAQELRFWCNLTETESAPFLAALELVNAEKLTINNMRFWRQSCVGTEKLLRPARAGVTGGSLEDKVIHDLAVSIGFLEAHGLAREPSAHQVDAQLLLPMLCDLEKAHSLNPAFMDRLGSRQEVADLDAAADASFRLGVDWRCNDRVVRAEYSTSWVGVSPELRTWMQSHGHAETAWLGLGTVRSRELRPGYRLSEARVGYLGCSSPRGTPVDIFINFLSRDGKPFEAPLQPWVKRRTNGGELEEMSLPTLQYDDALGGVFARVIKAFVGSHTVPLLEAPTVLLAHSVMFEARRRGLQLHYDRGGLAKELVARLDEQLIPFTLQAPKYDVPPFS